ncbi:MAG: glycosyltransferase family 4 protein [Rhodospirillaceae bacterium]|nr:glycosyltransferase family 4 protein [Rhodospirillaceae bacterium]
MRAIGDHRPAAGTLDGAILGECLLQPGRDFAQRCPVVGAAICARQSGNRDQQQGKQPRKLAHVGHLGILHGRQLCGRGKGHRRARIAAHICLLRPDSAQCSMRPGDTSSTSATALQSAGGNAGQGKRVRPMRILVVDGSLPTPSTNAGSAAVVDLVAGLIRLGGEVYFYPDGKPPVISDTELPPGAIIAGVPFAGLDGLMPWLHEHGPSLDYVILSRPGPGAKYLSALAALPRAPRIYFGHDIHFLRLREGNAQGRKTAPAVLRGMEALERHAWRRSDLVVYPSDKDVHEVLQREPGAAALSIPIYRMALGQVAEHEPRPERQGALFVGGALHQPNRDAIEWFAAAILDDVRAQVPGFFLEVVGDWPESLRSALERPGLVFRGRLSARQLDEANAKARIAVAPVRFGGGVKRKIVDALARGLPVVSTACGLDGLEGEGPLRHALLAGDARAFVSGIARLARDDVLWRSLAIAGREFIRDRYDDLAYDDGLRRMLRAADAAALRRLRL